MDYYSMEVKLKGALAGACNLATKKLEIRNGVTELNTELTWFT